MSERVENNESAGIRVAPVWRLRVSILEMMWLVAALAVSFRWPGLTVPAGLLFLYSLAQRRDIFRRQTRVAFGQIASASALSSARSNFLARSIFGALSDRPNGGNTGHL